MIDTPPSTSAPAVQTVATVIGRMFGRPMPGVGEEGTVWMSRPRIDVIDFYPANPSTNHPGEPRAL